MSRTGVGLLLLTAVMGVVLALVAWNASGSPDVDQVAASVVRQSAPVRERVTRTGRELVSTVDEEPETWPVLCEVTGGERLSRTVRLIDGDTELVGMLDDNELGLMSPVADFDGGFELDGYRFASVSWDLGWDDVVDCDTVEVEWLGGHVTGQVADDEGLPVAQAGGRGCGDWQDADDSGRFSLRTTDEACTLVAAWPQAADGVPTASLDVEVGDDVLLVLEAPAIVSGHVRNSAGTPSRGCSSRAAACVGRPTPMGTTSW
ncbi:MAG: hypothetical protein GY913_04900 [Proteobacteria bacterium]|nr:hypothetical protein [Pseudomonadota bacterium]MCP4916240.1 hypothetical protein [Pseudomonadota bacterium]